MNENLAFCAILVIPSLLFTTVLVWLGAGTKKPRRRY